MTLNPAPLVSVLVPVFNAERHLSRCLQSAAQQSLDNIEIVCTDDASTDGSAKIIQAFRQSDGRFRFLRHDQNRGEGAARNTCIDHAQGRYVFHLDADDTLPETALEVLWKTASTYRSQLVKGAYRLLSDDGAVIADRLQAPIEPVSSTWLRDSEFLRRVPVGHWSYLYERIFLNTNHLRYRTDMRVGLDLVALSEALVAARRVSLLPDVVYHYWETSDSASRSVTTPDIVRDGMKTKMLVSDNLRFAGYADAAANVLKAWDWQIRAFWAGLSPDTPEDAFAGLFADFRRIIPQGLVPWTRASALDHRYLLASILLGHDNDARELLRELRLGASFLESSLLCSRCARILELCPEDAEARMYARA